MCVHQTKIKMPAGHGEITFPTYLGCWENSVPYNYRTEVCVFLLPPGGHFQLLEDTTLFCSWPASSNFQANNGRSPSFF